MSDDDDYEHPVAVPLSWTVVGAFMIAINVEDAFVGDWVSAAVAFCGLFLAGMGGVDLFKRWRRSQV